MRDLLIIIREAILERYLYFQRMVGASEIAPSDFAEIPMHPETSYQSYCIRYRDLLCSLYSNGFPVSSLGKWSKTSAMPVNPLKKDVLERIGRILENAGIDPRPFLFNSSYGILDPYGPVRKNDRDFVRACALLLNEYTAYRFPGNDDWFFKGTRCRVTKEGGSKREDPVTAVYMYVAVSDYVSQPGVGDVMYYDQDMHYCFYDMYRPDRECPLSGNWQIRSKLNCSWQLREPEDSSDKEQYDSFTVPVTVAMDGTASVSEIPVASGFDTGYLRNWGNRKYNGVTAQQIISNKYDDFEVFMTAKNFPDPKYKYWDLQF